MLQATIAIRFIRNDWKKKGPRKFEGSPLLPRITGRNDNVVLPFGRQRDIKKKGLILLLRLNGIEGLPFGH